MEEVEECSRASGPVRAAKYVKDMAKQVPEPSSSDRVRRYILCMQYDEL